MTSACRFFRFLGRHRPVAMWVAGIFAVAVCLLAASPAGAAEDPADGALQVSVDALLSVQGEAVGVVVEGAAQVLRAADSMAADVPTSVDVDLALCGPLSLEEMSRSADRLPEPEPLELVWTSAGDSLGSALSSGRKPEAAETVKIKTVLPLDAVDRPGAYLVMVTVRSPSGSVARGSAWLGRVAAEGEVVDIAFVWPLVRGVHRDVAGVFFSDALTEALDPSDDASLWSAIAWALHFPELHFSLAVEPVVLTQLTELSDGYQRLGAAAEVEEIGHAEESSVRAAELLTTLKETVQSDIVDVIVTPYAGASPAVTAERGWDDGFAQVQLGRQVTQQMLALDQPVDGAFSYSLDISTAGIRCFSGAFIDHVLVDAAVAGDLAETEGLTGVSARVRDAGAERLTLLFADNGVRKLVAAPWDVGVLCAGLAARMASSPGQPMIVMPASPIAAPPQSYMESLGAVLTRIDRLRTRTLDELVREHSPGSRPVFLNRSVSTASTYIGLSLLESVAEAHDAVAALAQAAGSSPSPVQKAQLLLYTAESDWWSLPGTSPEMADAGLTYAQEAKTVAEAELGKLTVRGVREGRVMGRGGSISLTLENGTHYPVEAEVSLSGSGFRFPGGEVVMVMMPPGETMVPIEVARGSADPRLQVELLAGTLVIDTWDGDLRFITVLTFVPWVAAVIGLIAVAVVIVVLRRSRTKRTGRSGATS